MSIHHGPNDYPPPHPTIRGQVEAFMRAFDQPILPTPKQPSDALVRLRAKVIAEEAIETVEAMTTSEPLPVISLSDIWRAIDRHEKPGHHPLTLLSAAYALVVAHIEDNPIGISDMVKVADGLADLDYVVEGARRTFGIDGQPIADIVHACNMAKVGGPKRADGKHMKPPGWEGPEAAIERELMRQRGVRMGGYHTQTPEELTGDNEDGIQGPSERDGERWSSERP